MMHPLAILKREQGNRLGAPVAQTAARSHSLSPSTRQSRSGAPALHRHTGVSSSRTFSSSCTSSAEPELAGLATTRCASSARHGESCSSIPCVERRSGEWQSHTVEVEGAQDGSCRELFRWGKQSHKQQWSQELLIQRSAHSKPA